METLLFQTSYGLQKITSHIQKSVKSVSNGIVHIFCQHTSCSLLIMEGADDSVQNDLQAWLDKTVKNESYFTHTYEGDDDMPAHIKTALTNTSLTIPVKDGKLLLGTWQEIYLWEHRKKPSTRSLIVTVIS